MTKNIFDSALEGITDIVESVSDSFSKEFKGSNPFDKEKVSLKEQVYLFETDGENTFNQIAETQGLDEAVKWTEEMQKARGQNNG